MNLVRLRPSAPLDRYVECLWWSVRDEAQLVGEHMLPSGRAQLIFTLHDVPMVCRSGSPAAAPVMWSRGVVHGPQSKYYRAGPKPRGAVVGVSFKPAASALLGAPVSEFTDQHVPIEELWGARARSLHEQLCGADSPAASLKMLERELCGRLVRPLLLHPAVAHALGRHGEARWDRRLTDIQRETGYSARHFIALFHSAVGLTPKHYFRVQRFTAVVKQLAGASRPNLARIAAMTGYADQSHMSRDFREFAGISPREYRPPSPDFPLHHRMPAPLE
jgi:AraC-like DNA-binding protein